MSPMHSIKNDEKALLEACIKGDPKAQEELYDRYAPRMYAICRSYSENDLEAQDLLQEAFIKVFKNIEKCSSEGSLEAWVRRVVVNNNIDHYRHKNKKYGIKETATDEDLNNDEEIVENEALRSFHQNDLLRILRILPKGYRMVLNLYIVEGYPHKEIAEMLGISVSTSKSQFFRAKELLKKKLGRESIEEYFAAI